jgi:hypothetical protein
MAKEALIYNPFYILIGFIILAIATVVILTVVETRLRRKVKMVETANPHLIKLEKILKSRLKPERKLDLLSETAKKFFQETHSLDSKISYYDLIGQFKKKNEPKLASFCESMLQSYYSKTQLSNPEVNSLISILASIIREKDTEKKQQITQKIIQEKHILDFPSATKKELQKEIDLLSQNRKKAKDILNRMSSNKEILDLSKKNIKTEEETKQFLMKNLESFKRLREFYIEIKQLNTTLNSSFERVYSLAKGLDKTKLDETMMKFRQEQSSLLEKEHNPFKQHITKAELLERNFTRLGLVASRIIINNKL